MLSFHPDRNSQEGSAEKFVAIREAWEILSDPEARLCYDAYLADRRCVYVFMKPFALVTQVKFASVL